MPTKPRAIRGTPVYDPRKGVKSETPTWKLDVDGVIAPLVPALPALLGIEATTGRTIYQHTIAASQRAVMIRDLALIVRFLAGADAPVDGLKAPISLGAQGLVVQQFDCEQAESIIMRIGMIEVLAEAIPALACSDEGRGRPRRPPDREVGPRDGRRWKYEGAAPSD